MLADEYELLYRFLFVYLAGYFLCLSGSLTQITTKNALSSPSTLGFTGLGVLFVLISYFLLSFSDTWIPLEQSSFFLFIICSSFTYFFFKKSSLFDGNNIVLLGIGFNLFIGAIFSVVQFLLIAKGQQFPSSIWFGNFRFFELEYFAYFIPMFLVAKLFVSRYSKGLALLNFGRGFALNFSTRVDILVKRSLLLSLCLTVIVICFFGVFSFLGLVMPHILRQISFFKYSVERELRYGPSLSALVLLILDALCYNFPIYGSEIPVGMLSAVFGSLALITLLIMSERKRSKL